MCLAIPGQLQERFESQGLPMGRVSFAGAEDKATLTAKDKNKPSDEALACLVGLGSSFSSSSSFADAR